MNAAVEPVAIERAVTDRWDVAAATTIGNVRTENQDRVTAAAMADGAVAILVADGMGGMPNGGEAATVATDAALARLTGAAPSPEVALAALGDGNAAVSALRDQVQGQPGTTFTLALVGTDATATLAHAGDTRAYLLRDGTAAPLTDDHSWVGFEVRRGALPPGSERRDPRRNQVMMALLGDPIEPQVTQLPLLAGDLLMVCSDGFWEPLSDEQIAELLGTGGPLQAVVARSVEAALDAGSRDNVSVVALRLPG